MERGPGLQGLKMGSFHPELLKLPVILPVPSGGTENITGRILSLTLIELQSFPFDFMFLFVYLVQG